MADQPSEVIKGIHAEYVDLLKTVISWIPRLEHDTTPKELTGIASEESKLYLPGRVKPITAFRLAINSAADELLDFWESKQTEYDNAVSSLPGSNVYATSRYDYVQSLYWDKVTIPNSVHLAQISTTDELDYIISIAQAIQETLFLEDLLLAKCEYPPIVLQSEIQPYEYNFLESISRYTQGTLDDPVIKQGFDAFCEAIQSISKINFDPIAFATQPDRVKITEVRPSDFVDFDKLRELISTTSGKSGFELGTDPELMDLFKDGNNYTQFKYFSALLRHIGDLFQTESLLLSRSDSQLRTITHPGITEFSLNRLSKELVTEYSLTSDHIAAYCMQLPELNAVSHLSPTIIAKIKEAGALDELILAFREAVRGIHISSIDDFAEVAREASNVLQSEIQRTNDRKVELDKLINPDMITGTSLLAGVSLAGVGLTMICPPLGSVATMLGIAGLSGSLPAAYKEAAAAKKSLEDLEQRPIGILSRYSTH